ncbi:peptidase M76 family-domain-containing protein [Cercophora newfieldiana]|uniref:Mitochondrial inner membrane protease ATP23 n=1 Tax=Cercophora newfieldiana TaxID=92897 RepID=A0AA39Y7E3_9PEZI|nr:peptidase M76 family-domain-containing protein [Cercophora newfieldiana]
MISPSRHRSAFCRHCLPLSAPSRQLPLSLSFTAPLPVPEAKSGASAPCHLAQRHPPPIWGVGNASRLVTFSSIETNLAHTESPPNTPRDKATISIRLANRLTPSSRFLTTHRGRAPSLASPRPTPTMSSSTAPPSGSEPSPSASTPQPASLPRFLPNDPARTGYDPTAKWWLNYFRILSGSVTREGLEHYREDRYRANEARDCARCEQWRDWVFTYSPVVRFLSEKITNLNGSLDATNVVCRRCPGRVAEDGSVVRQAGGFSPQHGILLCANELRNRGHLEDTLAHEMVHAWDHLRFKVDWAGKKDLRHSACTEIRAAMLSGECRWTREAMTRGNWTLTEQFQECVRKRAVHSVMARPTCKDDVQAVKVVNEVWDSCFSDKRPFEEVYR